MRARLAGIRQSLMETTECQDGQRTQRIDVPGSGRPATQGEGREDLRFRS
jgi:hypothetical protein